MRTEDIIVAKLGSGPQSHKYTVEQMLSLYAGLLEKGSLNAPPGLDEDGRLLDQETQHKLLKLLGDVAQQMVSGLEILFLLGARPVFHRHVRPQSGFCRGCLCGRTGHEDAWLGSER